jgi:HD-GYP domain-containing protein (c-di-GMP phosphodiesterase class II)
VALNRGAFLHDVGKVAVPDAVLLKPGRLTASERAVMQQHTVIGDRLCSGLRLLEDVRPIVRHHHDHPDGTGYPDGLAGDAIPLLARILSVVDVYDALTTERPYNRPWRRTTRVESCVKRLPRAGSPSLSSRSSSRSLQRRTSHGLPKRVWQV